MKEQFFKIIELDNFQVLVSKDFDNDDEDNPDLLCIIFFVDGIKIQQKLGFSNAEKRDNAFDNITKEQVEKTVLQTVNYFTK